MNRTITNAGPDLLCPQGPSGRGRTYKGGA